MASRSRLRSGTARFMGAVLGLVLYLSFILVTGSGERDPTSNAGMIWLLVGAVICMVAGAWLLPWVRRRFSAHHARRKARRGR